MLYNVLSSPTTIVFELNICRVAQATSNLLK